MMPSTAEAPAPRRLFRARPGAGAARAVGAVRFWHLDSGTPPPTGDFIALAPGSAAPLLHLALPEALADPAREAVARRQLRDRLGAAADRLDLRPARLGARARAWNGMLATAREALDGWRTQVARAPGRCRAILPDYLALPAAPGVWTVATGEDSAEVRVRLGPDDGFAAEPALAAVMLGQTLDRARMRQAEPVAVLRLGPPEPEVDAALATLRVVAGTEALPEGVTRPQVLGAGEMALDLARDAEGLAGTIEARIRALRLPLALLLAGLVAWVGAIEIEARRNLALASALTDATVAAVRRDFLPEGPLLDIPVQVQRELDRRRALNAPPPPDAGPLERLQTAGAVIAGQPVQLEQVALQADGGLTLDLSLPDFAALDTLAAALRSAGLAARVGRSGTEPGGRISATVVIGEEG